MDIKRHFIGENTYYRLFSVTPQIGYTYQELYQSYGKMRKKLGLIKYAGGVFIRTEIADTLMAETPGYVPAEKLHKREPLMKAESDSQPSHKTVLGLHWIKIV